ncbi:gastrin-releasing peptide [Boleophthalmus pectinirostris]|uniref:gastrin-releasing peptide n=1 Tax=Boleophthalmus pectinirostris TaxID=150288 RepID=UPI00242B43EB|nr:gastrin-releasing peptide [Boleophthalmus pectinirostris]
MGQEKEEDGHRWTMMYMAFFGGVHHPVQRGCDLCESPVPGKMYPRGNHWAVGHLMGKKSVSSFATLQQSDHNSDNLRDWRTEEATQYARLMQRKTHQLKAAQMHNLALLHSRRRRVDRYKYLREINDLLLLTLKLQENDSI